MLEKKISYVNVLKNQLVSYKIDVPEDDSPSDIIIGSQDKKYVPYQSNGEHNGEIVTLLTADEKIAELTSILNEFEHNKLEGENTTDNEKEGMRKRVKELEELNYNLSNKLAYSNPTVKTMKEELENISSTCSGLKDVMEKDMQILA